MDINFSLNDRKGSNQLSDRIIESGDYVFNELLADDYIQKLLMNGQMTDNNVLVAHRRESDARYYASYQFVLEAFKSVSQLTDIEEEKQIFTFMIEGLTAQFFRNSDQFEKAFGKLDAAKYARPLNHWMYSYQMHTLYHCKVGPFLRGLVTFLPAFLHLYRVVDYLKENPNYLANDFIRCLCFEELEMQSMVKQLRLMIDRREEQISKEEEAVLCDIFARSVAYERGLENHEYNGGKWYEG